VVVWVLTAALRATVPAADPRAARWTVDGGGERTATLVAATGHVLKYCSVVHVYACCADRNLQVRTYGRLLLDLLHTCSTYGAVHVVSVVRYCTICL
jgi:hypothetical protein